MLYLACLRRCGCLGVTLTVIACVQVELSLCHSYPLHSGLLDACQELGVSLVAYSPLAMGRLTGKYSTACKPQVRSGTPSQAMHHGLERQGVIGWQLRMTVWSLCSDCNPVDGFLCLWQQLCEPEADATLAGRKVEEAG